MRVEGFNQASTHVLVFPFTLDNEHVNNINDAKFSLRRGSEVVVEYTLAEDNELSFSNSVIEIELNNSLTVELNTTYTFELWFKDTIDRPYLIRKGTLIFENTNTRF